MRCLVTGDAGFIGSHVTRRLLSQRFQVLGVDSITDYYDPELKRARLKLASQEANYLHLDAQIQSSTFHKAAIEFDPDVIIHLAAQAGVRYSLEHPEEYLDTNVMGTSAILEIAKAVRPTHLLVASTSSVYGGSKTVPFSETDLTLSPLSTYAATKISAEALTHSASCLFDIPTTIMRFFTVYGPWGRPDMALFRFVDSILGGREIQLFGYGQTFRDYTYIEDLVDSIAALIKRPPVKNSPIGAHDSLSPAAPFRTVNISGGKPVQLREFLSAVEESLGKVAKLQLLPIQPGEMENTAANVQLLDSLVPSRSVTDVREGVGQFVSWFKTFYSV